MSKEQELYIYINKWLDYRITHKNLKEFIKGFEEVFNQNEESKIYKDVYDFIDKGMTACDLLDELSVWGY